MTLRFLLDTSVVSNPVSRKPNADIIKRLSQHDEKCGIAAPVWHELNYGCQRLPPGRRQAALETYLTDVVQATFPIVPYDAAAAAWHASERSRLETLGTPAPYVDGQIAAISRVNGLILVTLNARDFLRFEGLHVEDWSKRRSRR